MGDRMDHAREQQNARLVSNRTELQKRYIPILIIILSRVYITGVTDPWTPPDRSVRSNRPAGETALRNKQKLHEKNCSRSATVF